MEHQDYLLTIAEVAATFVGFSMVVGVIRPDMRSGGLRRSTMYDVALIGFFVVGGALVPYALSAHQLSPSTVWRIASLGLLVVWVLAYLAALHRFQRAHGAAFLAPMWGRVLAIANPLVVLVGNGMLLWNVVSPDSSAGARYLVALLGLLLIAAYLFLNAVFGDSDAERPR
jgi:hypothetical protein